MAEHLNIPALKAFADAITKDPSLLFSAELDFLRAALSQFGELKKPAGSCHHNDDHDHDHGHKHEHAHEHEHEHEHGHHKAGHADEHHHHEGHSPEEHEQEEEDPERMTPETEKPLSVPAGGEDWDGAADAKEKAAEARANGDFSVAVEMFTKALSLGQVSAIALANRAECLLKLRRPLAAISDCDAAIAINPDSAKALRCRGKALRYIGKWEDATRDLSAAQRIDFDADVEAVLKFVTAKVAKLEARRAEQRNLEEKRKLDAIARRKAEIEAARKRQAEEEAAEAARHHGHSHAHGAGHHHHDDEDEEEDGEGFDFGGAAGGFPGMGGGAGGLQNMLMQMLMSDPDLAAGLQNPKLMSVFTSVLQGGGLNSPQMQEAMKDPEVKRFMDKITSKLGPLMGMMGGMGGMGGNPFGGRAAPAEPEIPRFDEEVD